jgi:hypothetical protein
MSQGKLDIDSGNALIAGMQSFITAKVGGDLEARIALLEQSQPPQRLGVSLGLGLQIGPVTEAAPGPEPTTGPTIDGSLAHDRKLIGPHE